MDSEITRHKLWNPVPRKVQRKDDGQSNLMANVLRDLVAKSYNKSADDILSNPENLLQ